MGMDPGSATSSPLAKDPVDVDPPPDIAGAPTAMEEFALAAGDAIPTMRRPPWLMRPPPKKRPFVWPSGGKSPSWFKRFGMCPKNHAHRYRRKRPDPSGLYALVGRVIHGAIEDAANIRMFPGRRGKGIPPLVSKEELLYLLELQRDALRQDTDVIEAPTSFTFVTTEVLARARDIVTQLARPIDLSNMWIDPRTKKGGAEYIWQFLAGPGLLIAGILDLIQVQYHPTNPNAAPLMVTISDWKTGDSQLPTVRELELDPQAQLQLAWARRMFPSTPVIRFKVVNLTHGTEVYVDWSAGLEELTLSFCRAAFNAWQIEDEEAQVGRHCSYCPYRSDCKEYKEELNKATYQRPLGSLENMTMSELVQIHYQASVLFKLAETRKADAANLINGMLGDKRSYRAGNLLSFRKSRKNPAYGDTGQFLSELAEACDQDISKLVTDFCKVKKGKVEDWIMTLPVGKQSLARGVLKAHQVQRSSSSWIETHQKESVI